MCFALFTCVVFILSLSLHCLILLCITVCLWVYYNLIYIMLFLFDIPAPDLLLCTASISFHHTYIEILCVYIVFVYKTIICIGFELYYIVNHDMFECSCLSSIYIGNLGLDADQYINHFHHYGCVTTLGCVSLFVVVFGLVNSICMFYLLQIVHSHQQLFHKVHG